MNGLRSATLAYISCAALCLTPTSPAEAVTADDLEKVVNSLEKVCLSNISTTTNVSVLGLLKGWLSFVRGGLGGGISYSREDIIARGARVGLNNAISRIEDATIRDCMVNNLKWATARIAPQDEREVWPNPIAFKFDYTVPTPQGAPPIINVQFRSRQRGPREAKNEVLQPDGLFSHSIGYPEAGELVVGRLAPARQKSNLTANKIPITRVCVKRPATLPQSRREFDLFDCTAGGTCKPMFGATGWLGKCRDSTVATNEISLYHITAFQSEGGNGSPVSTQRRWIVPSLSTLSAGDKPAGGYSIISIRTDAFKHPEVEGVEVSVRVNGTAVEEDGLEPELRPVPNDPQLPFSYAFALEQLNFDGRYGGCEAVELHLTPLLADGRRGSLQKATLPLIALRGSEERSETMGKSQLFWSALYRLGSLKSRTIAFVGSYSYNAAALDQEAKMRAFIEQDKAWLDAQNFSFHGQRVVGVIRPPLKSNSKGRAYYGLALGLVQDNGQIQFLFPENDASALHAYVYSFRGKLAGSKRVLAVIPNFYNVTGSELGTHRLNGLCKALPAQMPEDTSRPARPL
ncbi:MAG: hypothetical protein ABW184_01795 [Sphingobium sp.]